MQFVKAFGLAALAAVAAMAFLGAGSASAQEHKIVLCKKLVTLCGVNDLWPSLTKIFALAEDPELQTSIGNILCEDSLVTAELAEEIGSPLKAKNITATFGKLPTPTLGTGCEGVCVESGGKPNVESIHAEIQSLEVIVEPENKYSLRGTGLALILNCPLVGTCVYRGENLISPIKHDGLHLAHKFEDPSNLPLAEFKETLNRQTSHGGSVFCPATSLWLANYTLYLVKAPSGTEGLAWPALDK